MQTHARTKELTINAELNVHESQVEIFHCSYFFFEVPPTRKKNPKMSGRNWSHRKRRKNSCELMIAAMKSGSSPSSQRYLYTYIYIYIYIYYIKLKGCIYVCGVCAGVQHATYVLYSVQCSAEVRTKTTVLTTKTVMTFQIQKLFL